MQSEPNVILIHYGEIALKGKNRPGFINYLRNNIEQKLACNDYKWPVRQAHGYLWVEVPAADGRRLPHVLAFLAEIPGITWFGPAVFVASDEIRPLPEAPNLALITDHVLALARRHRAEGDSFRIKVNRADKRFPLKSPQLERALGAAVIEQSDWAHVNLIAPDRTFHVNIQQQGIFFSDERREGVGGIPVGVAGKVLVMLSGGIDSPVAAYQMAKRGCPLDFIHFTATPAQQKADDEHKIVQLAAQISRFSRRSRLYLVPIKHFELGIIGHILPFETILFRRFVARVAEELAGRIEAKALVSGDCVGQVASQTIENMVSVSQSVTLPIFRPLLTLDKREIMQKAERIGTYPLSIEPYKDCCALLTDKPDTRTNQATLTAWEQQQLPAYDQLIQKSLAEAVSVEYLYGTKQSLIARNTT